ncbi:hypothetical protein [Actinomadura opuntiae]|uniref:hypothetical protein n=1 Tax=Actinomadura sp. OS1-43 TaxID=604315 RepID=UPI00255A88AC|nr:hypothetical protein [Actinomadura sp. OS1-43]MDL4815995.1 hypothetical protein [Actinomadura sp. OS1-43]
MPKKERQQADRAISLIFVIAFAYTAFIRNWIAFIALIFLGAFIYLAFFRQTSCDVERVDGGACGNTAYGWLGACHFRRHKRIKRNAILAGMTLRRPAPEPPARRYRGSERDNHEEATQISESGGVTRLAYDCAMLIATVAGSVASILALATPN